MTACLNKIRDEEQALELYECSNDNMFGLEKIALFNDRVVLVFDKKKSSKYRFVGFVKRAAEKKTLEDASFDLGSESKEIRGYGFKERNGNYFFTQYLKFPPKEGSIYTFCKMSMTGIEIAIDDGKICLHCSCDRTEYYQKYDLSKKKWSKIDYYEDCVVY